MHETSRNSTEERYRIEFRGRVAEGREREGVIEGLAALFKCEQRNITGLFNGKSHVLKKNLPWENALKYYHALAKKGAVCDIKVMMDAASFRGALVPSAPEASREAPSKARGQTGAPDDSDGRPNVEDAPAERDIAVVDGDSGITNEKKEEALPKDDFQTLRFDLARVVPTLCHPAHEEQILDEEKTVVGRVSSHRFAVSRVGGLFIAILISLPLEMFVSDMYARHIDTSLYSYLFPFLLFVSGLIVLPILVRPLRKVGITLGVSGKEVALNCEQTNRIQYVRSRFTVKDSFGRIVCEMMRNNLLHRHACRDAGGEILFTAEEEPDVSELVLGAADELRNEVIDIRIFQNTGMVVSKLLKKKRGKRSKKKGSNNKASTLSSLVAADPGKKKRKGKHLFVIRDAGQQAIGHLLRDRFCTLTLYDEKHRTGKSRRGVLIAFCLLIAGL